MDELDGWLERVASGEATMSQRRVDWAERNGGIALLVEKARAKGVHLVQLTDDKGHELLAASRKPFKTLC